MKWRGTIPSWSKLAHWMAVLPSSKYFLLLFFLPILATAVNHANSLFGLELFHLNNRLFLSGLAAILYSAAVALNSVLVPPAFAKAKSAVELLAARAEAAKHFADWTTQLAVAQEKLSAMRERVLASYTAAIVQHFGDRSELVLSVIRQQSIVAVPPVSVLDDALAPTSVAADHEAPYKRALIAALILAAVGLTLLNLGLLLSSILQAKF